MTTEQNAPQGFSEAQPGLFPAPTQNQGQPQGQSQNHRRRRRRKKAKQAAQQANGQNGGQSNAQNSAPNPPQAAPAQQQQQPRKQKNFSRSYQKQNSQNFGNGNGNGQQGQGGGGRRKQKQRKQQVFVGPMDHSYRAVNGNVADAPPSTIEFRNGNGSVNGNIASYMDSPYEPPVPIREDAPTRIFCFIDDLFFLAKINEVSRKLGIKVGFVKGADKDVLAKLTETTEEERPSLIIFDLNNANAKPLTLIPKIKAKLKRGTSVIGFLSHVQGDLKVKAIEAGCDTVMPRSAFSQNLPNLLRRHGAEEEEEFESVGV